MTEILTHLRPDDIPWLVTRHAEAYAASDGFDESFGALVAVVLKDFETGHDPACERAFIARDTVAGTERRLGGLLVVREDENTARLRLVFLIPEARGTGLAQRLLDAAIGFARRAEYRRMVLWTHESHRAAGRLYARNGWQCLSSRPAHSFGVDVVEQRWSVDL